MNKKENQLGMPFGTACHRLRKLILFNLLKEINKNYCFQCGSEIESVEEFSIEHKIPYLDSENPTKLFFDMNNIAFSHLSCNVSAGRRRTNHGKSRYGSGCRCDICKAANYKHIKNYRAKKKLNGVVV